MPNTTNELIEINGAVIEFEFAGNNVEYIITHLPLFSKPGDAERIDSVIDEYLSYNSRLIQEWYKLKGMVHVVKWKVVYE